jgi:hypothetical protein
MIVYNSDGTKVAEYGSNIKNNPVNTLTFELSTSGCGALNFSLLEMPDCINYGTRIDVHLFGSASPWYSGFIVQKPVAGTTARPFAYVGHGFINQLKRIVVNWAYADMDIAGVAKDLVQNYVNSQTDIVFRSSKITTTGYVLTRLNFDYCTAEEAIKQLSEYALNYVYGVDADREFFFKPLLTAVNEAARLTVGVHIDNFEPTESLDNLVNYAYIKAGTLDSGGSNIACTVQDATSQAAYGKVKVVLTIPSAISAADAQRWGLSQIDKYKDPTQSAKIKGLRLNAPAADGSFMYRKITPEGQAIITDLDGNTHQYPISKIKYTVNSAGITADLELGEPTKRIEDWFAKAQREKKQSDYLQSLNNIQLSGGTV